MHLFAYTEPGWLYPPYINMHTVERADEADAGMVTIMVRGPHLPGSEAVPGQAAVPPRAPSEDGLDPGHAGFPAIPAVPAVPPAPGVLSSISVTITEFYTGVLNVVAGIAPGSSFAHPSGLTISRDVAGGMLTFAIGQARCRMPVDVARRDGAALRHRATVDAEIVRTASKLVPLDTRGVERIEREVAEKIEQAMVEDRGKPERDRRERGER